MANEATHVRAALARAIANRQISDEVIDMTAKQLAAAKLPIRAIDICVYGICIDYFVDDKDWWRSLPEMITLEGAQVKGIEIFPWGIPFPDIFRVRVAHSIDAMPQLRG